MQEMHLEVYSHWRNKFRILVCGGRKYSDFATIYDCLNIIVREFGLLHKNVLIIVGGAKGADTFGEEWAYDLGVSCEIEYADWGRYGMGAGPKRNQKMLDDYSPHLVVAAPGGRGTADMMRRARNDFVEVLDLSA